MEVWKHRANPTSDQISALPLTAPSTGQSVMHALLVLQVAVPEVKEAAKDADILVFVLPHQFVRGVCNQLKGTLKESTIAVTLIKVRSVYFPMMRLGGCMNIAVTLSICPCLSVRFL